jgi:chaperone LolA
MLHKILFLLIFPVTFYAQTANAVIAKVQEKFIKIDNLQADFEQGINSVHSSEVIDFVGKFFYKKGDSFRIELPNRMIISDGKSVWNFDKKQNKVVISDAEFDEASFSLKKIIFTYPAKCKLTLVKSENNLFYVKAVPTSMELSFKEVYLSINNKFLLNKVEIVDFNNMKFTFELFNISLNKNLDNKLFQYQPSTEVEVIDLR